MVDLANFIDNCRYEEVAQGISHIVANVRDLNEAVHQLHQADQFRTSNIMRGLAEEEAAKVLILIDAVRCPADKRRNTLKWFGNHLAKRIYAVTSSYSRIWTFGELCEFVDLCRRPYSLDGPNDIDWLVRNEILAEREQAMYVDFVQDETEGEGEYFWIAPYETGFPKPPFQPSDVVTLTRALSDAGIGTIEGLAVVNEVWRDFTPSAEMNRSQLMKFIECTLNRLIQQGLASGHLASLQFILSSWSFPLWPLDLRANMRDFPTVQELREQRARKIRHIETTVALRDPPPPIKRKTVEVMHEAYVTWMRDVEEYDRKELPKREMSGLRIRTTSEFNEWCRLPSYKRLMRKFRELDKEERIGLLALAWFARDRVVNWPEVFEHATNMVGHTDDEYQVGLGKHWLPGLDQWKTAAPPFRAGATFRD